MSGRNMTLDVLVRLKDNLSGPLRRLKGNLQGLTSFVKKIGVLGTAISAISFMGPINEAASFQQQLIDIAGTAELSGRAAFAFVDQARGKYEDLALAIGQHSDTIAAGVGQMIAAGVDQSIIDGSIRDIGRAATAANAEFADMASIAQAAAINLKLPADRMGDALGALVVAGKEGSFELKDMAKNFAQLTPQVAKFGVTGREAIDFLGAGLQIAMKGASDPAQAANNFRNFLSKALAPDTVKRFKDMGVDIQAVMLDATAKGINPLEAMLQKVSVLTGVNEKAIAKYMATAKAQGLEGADALAFVREQLEAIGAAGQISKLFGDQQVLDFVVPFMANIDEYKRIKEKVAAATGAAIDDDFATQMEGLNRQRIRFREIGTQATRIVGFAFGQWMPIINDHLETALRWVRELDASTGGWVSQLLTMGGGVLIAVAALGALGVVLPIVGAGLGALAALAGVILSPLGAVIGLLAAGGAVIAKNWDRFGPRIMRVWDRARSSFQRLASTAVERGRGLIASGRALAERYGPIVAGAMERAWDGLAAAGSSAWRTVRDDGAVAMEDLRAGWNNLREFFDGFMSTVSAGALGDAFTLDAAKVAVVEALGFALETIRGAWQGLREFGAGFAPWLRGIGENMGGTINAIVGIGEGLGRLARAIFDIAGIDRDAAGGFFKWLGNVAGGALEIATATIEKAAQAIEWLVKGIAGLAEMAAGGFSINWSSLLPGTVVDLWNRLATAINVVAAALKRLGADVKPAKPFMSPRALGSLEDDSMKMLRADPGGHIADALDEARQAAAGRRAARAAQPPVKLAGNVGITIKVDGPGKVSGISNDNPKQIKVGGNGRVVGRV